MLADFLHIHRRWCAMGGRMMRCSPWRFCGGLLLPFAPRVWMKFTHEVVDVELGQYAVTCNKSSFAQLRKPSGLCAENKRLTAARLLVLHVICDALLSVTCSSSSLARRWSRVNLMLQQRLTTSPCLRFSAEVAG